MERGNGMIQRFLKVQGSPFERGKQIGTALKLQIETNIASQKIYFDDDDTAVSRWLKQAEAYVSRTKAHAPKVYEELAGMADGSGLGMAPIVYLYTIYERTFFEDPMAGKCTSFAVRGEVSEDGKLICGQTNDERLDQYRSEADCILHHVDEKEDMEQMIYTHPGIPAYMGMNNYGLSVLWTFIDNGLRNAGLPTAAIIRYLLEMKTLEEAREFLCRLPHAVPNQFTIAHSRDGIISLECFPNKVYEARGDVLLHANHNCIALTEPDTGGSKTTHARLQAMEKAVKKNCGKINAEIGKKILADHGNFPKSICNHPSPEHPRSKTLASMVFDGGEGAFHLAFGNACEQHFHTYCFDHWKG